MKKGIEASCPHTRGGRAGRETGVGKEGRPNGGTRVPRFQAPRSLSPAAFCPFFASKIIKKAPFFSWGKSRSVPLAVPLYSSLLLPVFLSSLPPPASQRLSTQKGRRQSFFSAFTIQPGLAISTPGRAGEKGGRGGDRGEASKNR